MPNGASEKTGQDLSGLSPEAELLICCARTVLDSGTNGRIRALVHQVADWPYLMRMAEQHKVKPLVYRNLSAACPDAIPKEVFDPLQHFFLLNAMANTQLNEELGKILNLFAANGVPALPYKGPALAAALYGESVLRQFGDLDLLVRRRDVLKARDLLISANYRSNLTAEQENARLDSHYHLDFIHEINNVFVELHWALTPRFWEVRLDLESLENRLVSVQLAGKTIPQLPMEELLLVLCAHGAKHYWNQLRWICDVAELICQKQSLDWPKLIGTADRLRCRRILFLGVFVAQDVLGARIPESVSRQIAADSVVPQLAAHVSELLFPDRNCAPATFDHRRFFLRTRENLRDRIRHFNHDRLQGHRHALSDLF